MSNLMQNNDDNKAHINYLENQLCLARREINNLRQQLKGLNHVHKKEIEGIERKLEEWRCTECRQRQQQQQGNSEDDEVHESTDLLFRPIGVINTNFPEKRGTPRQPGICPDTEAKLTLNNDIFTNPNHALEGLEEFSHMWILFHFHRNDSHAKAKVSPPRLNGARMGVFATRSPHRPNPIGLSLVKIVNVVGNFVYFNGVDMVDGTPVIDLKPYIPQYDNPDNFVGNINQINGDISSINPSTSSSQIENIRIMDGEENSRDSNPIGAVSNSISRTTVEEYTRSNSRIGEREAPDGEEEETPVSATSPNSVTIPTTPEGHIRVPSWIDQPPVSSLTVVFKDRALTQLLQLGNEGEQKKTIITNVLREDPRSIYLRERWGSHCYVFRIAELCVSCKFDDDTHTVTVYQVFQNNATDECNE